MKKPKPRLSEKDFIHEGYRKNPLPLWLWLFLLTAFTAIIWGSSNWYGGRLNLLLQNSPFLQVTNRDISLFLWQNPEYMRNHSKEKNAYLPGFQYIDKITLDIAQSDHYAIAPPELFFRYHTWKRLVSDEFTERPILKKQFVKFLAYAEEWQPRYWTGATKAYTQLVDSLQTLSDDKDLSTLSKEQLPMQVRMAFQGFENFFIDKEAINEIKPTYEEMQAFLASHPNYNRNFWRNVVEDQMPNYLKSFSATKKEDEKDEARTIPSDELTPFLRVAFYNYSKAKKT